MRRELRDAIARKIDEELIDAGVYEEDLEEIRKKYNKCISNASTIDQASQLAFIFFDDIKDENHSFEKLTKLYEMGMDEVVISLFDAPFYLKDNEFNLFLKMIKYNIPYFIIQAIRGSEKRELLSNFIIRDIKVEDILPGNNYGIYFQNRVMKIMAGYENIIKQRTLEWPECRNELSEFTKIRKWKIEDDNLRTKEGYDSLLDFNDNYNLEQRSISSVYDLSTEDDKIALDYAYNFDLALHFKGNQIRYANEWNLAAAKFLLQSKNYGKLEKISNLISNLVNKEINREGFDRIYDLVLRGASSDIPIMLLKYSDDDINLLDKYHFGYMNAFDNNNYSFDDDLYDEVEEAKEYCKNNGFDDNRRKKYILDKILQKLEIFKKSPAEMEKEKVKEASSNAKTKPTKTVESNSANTSSPKTIDDNRAEILKNLIKNNVDKSVLLASGFSEEEINKFMKPVDELLLNLIKNGVSDEILMSSGYSIDEINECKRYL